MVNEPLIHYLWKTQKFRTPLSTTDGRTFTVLKIGCANVHQGPDFIDGQILTDQGTWTGNIEIHVKSSDWYCHGHELDSGYDDVILHVVWEYDAPVFRADDSEIPCFEVRNFVSNSLVHNYHMHLNHKNVWIPCQRSLMSVPLLVKRAVLDQLYVERLEMRSRFIKDHLRQTTYDWEAVCFRMLCKGFGLNLNGQAFLKMSESFSFKILRKIRHNLMSIEALFFGQLGLIPQTISDAYTASIRAQYELLSRKFELQQPSGTVVKFFRLRPNNFPTIRLAQLARLYHEGEHLWSVLREQNTLEGLQKILKVSPSDYWLSHYNFDKASKHTSKSVSTTFANLLITNIVIPLRYTYKVMHRSGDLDRDIEMAQLIPSERNNLTRHFDTYGIQACSVADSKALLQLKAKYCDLKKCLHCKIGHTLLNRNM